MKPALTILGNTRIALAFSESSLAAGSVAVSFFKAAAASSSIPAAPAASAARGDIQLIVAIVQVRTPIVNAQVNHGAAACGTMAHPTVIPASHAGGRANSTQRPQ